MAYGDVYFVEIPQHPRGQQGKEQIGRRPAIAVQADTSSQLPTLMVIPSTSNLSALRFPHAIEVAPSANNGFSKPSVLLVFQLRAIDRSRISKRMGTLEEIYMDQIRDEIKKLLNLF